MFFKSIFLVVILNCAVEQVYSKHLPSYIPICKRDQATINKCVLDAIEKLRPRLAEGMPELNVAGFDPLRLAEIRPPPGQFSSINAIGRNVIVTGLSNFQIKSSKVDLNTLTIRSHVFFPKLYLKGRYSVDARILVLPIKGEGNFTAEAEKCEGRLVMRSKIEDRDGVDYVVFTKLDVDIKVKDYHIRLDGLFNGDPTLSEATNLALNENRGEFLRAAKPVLEKGISTEVLRMSNNIAKDVPYDELLPKP